MFEERHVFGWRPGPGPEHKDQFMVEHVYLVMENVKIERISKKIDSRKAYVILVKRKCWTCSTYNGLIYVTVIDLRHLAI